jgi:hypothetical protein
MHTHTPPGQEQQLAFKMSIGADGDQPNLSRVTSKPRTTLEKTSSNFARCLMSSQMTTFGSSDTN